jgi:hypothetical protein
MQGNNDVRNYILYLKLNFIFEGKAVYDTYAK